MKCTEKNDNLKSLRVQQLSKQLKTQRTQKNQNIFDYVLTFVAFSLPRTTKTIYVNAESLANNGAAFIFLQVARVLFLRYIISAPTVSCKRTFTTDCFLVKVPYG